MTLFCALFFKSWEIYYVILTQKKESYSNSLIKICIFSPSTFSNFSLKHVKQLVLNLHFCLRYNFGVRIVLSYQLFDKIHIHTVYLIKTEWILLKPKNPIGILLEATTISIEMHVRQDKEDYFISTLSYTLFSRTRLKWICVVSSVQ